MKHVRSHLPRVMLGLMISVSLVLAGCANNGTGSSMLGGSGTDPDPRLTKSTDSSFFSTSGLTACAAAAGVGILAC
ncbi:lipoprotein, partial [Pseudomonas syringae pv. actinidiae ICMP 18807]